MKQITAQKPDESIRIHKMVQDMLRNFGGNSDRILTAAKQLEMRTGVKTFWELGWYPAASELSKMLLNGVKLPELNGYGKPIELDLDEIPCPD